MFTIYWVTIKCYRFVWNPLEWENINKQLHGTLNQATTHIWNKKYCKGGYPIVILESHQLPWLIFKLSNNSFPRDLRVLKSHFDRAVQITNKDLKNVPFSSGKSQTCINIPLGLLLLNLVFVLFCFHYSRLFNIPGTDTISILMWLYFSMKKGMKIKTLFFIRKTKRGSGREPETERQTDSESE